MKPNESKQKDASIFKEGKRAMIQSDANQSMYPATSVDQTALT